MPTKYSQKQRMPRTAVETEDLVMLCICDYSGQVRGKGFPASELPARLKSGMGLAPTNLMINPLERLEIVPGGRVAS